VGLAGNGWFAHFSRGPLDPPYGAMDAGVPLRNGGQTTTNKARLYRVVFWRGFMAIF
jgi:hypothetical protein